MMAIRPILPSDNEIIAEIIRKVLAEYGADRPGFAWQDKSLDDMHSAYSADGSAYFVVELSGRVVGGGGLEHFDCDERRVCEIQKMYLDRDVRSRGYGKRLLTNIIDKAKDLRYSSCYLETFSEMSAAIRLYQDFGFRRLNRPLGDSGHHACDYWYRLDL